jgi:hypothetical protein
VPSGFTSPLIKAALWRRTISEALTAAILVFDIASQLDDRNYIKRGANRTKQEVVKSMDTLKNAGFNPNCIVLLPTWYNAAGH